MALIIGLQWATSAVGLRMARRPQGYFMAGLWLLTILGASGMIAWRFATVGPFHPVPTPYLAYSIAGSILSGSLLVGTVVAGCLAAWGEHDGPAAELTAAVRWLPAAIGLRALAIAWSLSVGAWFNPFGPRHFFVRLLTADSPFSGLGLFPIGSPHFLYSMAFGSAPLMALRLLIGLVLPFILSLLIILSFYTGHRQLARQQFPPALILVLIAEIIGAGLTVGMQGLAF